jgi:hypothetical protein
VFTVTFIFQFSCDHPEFIHIGKMLQGLLHKVFSGISSILHLSQTANSKNSTQPKCPIAVIGRDTAEQLAPRSAKVNKRMAENAVLIINTADKKITGNHENKRWLLS